MKCQFCEMLEVDEPKDFSTDNMEEHMIVTVNFDKHMEIHGPINKPDTMRLILYGIGSVMGWKITLVEERGARS